MLYVRDQGKKRPPDSNATHPAGMDPGVVGGAVDLGLEEGAAHLTGILPLVRVDPHVDVEEGLAEEHLVTDGTIHVRLTPVLHLHVPVQGALVKRFEIALITCGKKRNCSGRVLVNTYVYGLTNPAQPNHPKNKGQR